jgi:hypothetical protein
MSRAPLFFLCASLAAASVACGGSQRPASAPSEAKQDELIRYRAALADLRRHPLAGEATVDLEKAEAWLETAQGKLAADANGSKMRLYLDAIQAQLVKVKSYFSRREAQMAAQPTQNDAPKKDENDKEDAP